MRRRRRRIREDAEECEGKGVKKRERTVLDEKKRIGRWRKVWRRLRNGEEKVDNEEHVEHSYKKPCFIA